MTTDKYKINNWVRKLQFGNAHSKKWVGQKSSNYCVKLAAKQDINITVSSQKLLIDYKGKIQ